jgi:hypothetical protein
MEKEIQFVTGSMSGPGKYDMPLSFTQIYGNSIMGRTQASISAVLLPPSCS